MLISLNVNQMFVLQDGWQTMRLVMACTGTEELHGDMGELPASLSCHATPYFAHVVGNEVFCILLRHASKRVAPRLHVQNRSLGVIILLRAIWV
jgi:hypothetical protein